MENTNVPTPATPLKKSHTGLVAFIVVVLVILLARSAFHRSSATPSYAPGTAPAAASTGGADNAAPAARTAVAADSANPVIGTWLLASAQPDPDRGQWGVCSTYITFGKDTFSRNYNGKEEQGWITYIAGPTKVWVTMQGMQTTSYGVNPDGTIVAQDYPPCVYRRQ